MGKNSVLRYVLTLGVICLCASGLLGTVHALTQPKIEGQKVSQEEASLKDVFPTAADFEAVTDGAATLFYKALDHQKNLLGVVFKASRHGYSSDIVTLAGMDVQGMIVGIKVLTQNETPGLGTRATEPKFLSQFNGKKIDTLATKVDAVTGATITSRAVIDSVQETGQKILERVLNG